MQRIERQLKKRFAVGTHVSETVVMQDFVSRQHYAEQLVKQVLTQPDVFWKPGISYFDIRFTIEIKNSDYGAVKLPLDACW